MDTFLVQGSLTGDFNKYSAITIIDRQNLETVLSEQTQSLSGIYSDEEYISIGKLVNARYILSGSVSRTINNYFLELAVIDIESGIRIASYSPKPVSLPMLENLTAIKSASAELLGQLGANLTEIGLKSLNSVENTERIRAETALSKGIEAQRSGTIMEALTLYYEAANFDSSLIEAVSRSSQITTNIRSGNIGENVRNEIQQRNAWLKVLQEAASYFSQQPPFEILYNTELSTGKIDFNKGVVDISFEAGLVASAAGYKVIKDLKQGLEKTGKSTDWGFKNWPVSGEAAIFNKDITNFKIKASLLDEKEQIIGVAENEFIVKNDLSFVCDLKNMTFKSVDANKISDNLKIAFTSINNINPNNKPGYINIFADLELGLQKFTFTWIDEEIAVGRNKNFRSYWNSVKTIDTLPIKIGRLSITAIADKGFDYDYDNGLINMPVNIVIPNHITYIGSLTFNYGTISNNQETMKSIIIPDSVTFIGKFVFRYNNFVSITIPANLALTPGTFADSLSQVRSGSDKYVDFFVSYYNNGKKVGTYIISKPEIFKSKDIYNEYQNITPVWKMVK